jgi:hypothetical protein
MVPPKYKYVPGSSLKVFAPLMINQQDGAKRLLSYNLSPIADDLLLFATPFL